MPPNNILSSGVMIQIQRNETQFYRQTSYLEVYGY